ncbi:MAG: thiamine pyrophosphate-dependent enzyme [Bacteroidia bacterium]|nr:thiamine pyrophosphate-dependent enzyme [Bacteroidia bacterium]MDW8157292.1 thiamine pyrophosphate-dependent enzyme [Bacteroidia bacterium]
MLKNIVLEQEVAGVLEYPLTREQIIADYRLAFKSRQASMIGRREVLTGKAKFGIFGDGKEVAQLALAKFFEKGDIRAGYYRDQTWMFATGMLTIREFFSQLYAHTDIQYDPSSAGRQMNAHFATRMLDENGDWLNLTEKPQSSADTSPTASQMPRMLGLAQASKLYRNLKELAQFKQFSNNGNEVVFGTIGDASTSEGIFWETVNAAGVLQVPLIISVWDDNYGISVPIQYQTTKGSISTLLSGFVPTTELPGVDVYVVKGWDYVALINTYQRAVQKTRTYHTPAVIHVCELTQPQGHSTSGSHERYKSKERLQWEKEYDCLNKMRQWMIAQGIVTAQELDEMENQDKKEVAHIKAEAWELYQQSIRQEIYEVSAIIERMAASSAVYTELLEIKDQLNKIAEPIRRDVMVAVRKALVATYREDSEYKETLRRWKKQADKLNYERFSSHLYSESSYSALKVKQVPVVYPPEPRMVDGREVLQACFDAALARDPRVIAFGEDVGRLGDVNQAFAGLQQKYGEFRVADTGIREATIIGQGIGLAMRGLRPIAEIQYLDYLLYALEIISDDLCTLQYRTKGGQKAPLIIRTRGHRLEGIWHSGSPMGTIIHAFRGIHVLVPRNMTQAAGFYNTMLQSDEPALIIEVLNGYRLKEPMPANVGEFTVPLGVPEVLRSGEDITIVTYGPNCRLALEAAEILYNLGISVEVIDVQTLLPFDIHHKIVESLKKTSRILFLDEDVPGGATAYMMQKVLEEQNGYRYLDSAPRTLSGKPHRPAYASDGDYFSKPNVEDILQVVTEMMHEVNPSKYRLIY